MMAAGPESLCPPGAVGRGVSPAFSARRCRGRQLGARSWRACLSPLFPGYRAAAAGAKGASARRAFVRPAASPVVPRPAQPSPRAAAAAAAGGFVGGSGPATEAGRQDACGGAASGGARGATGSSEALAAPSRSPWPRLVVQQALPGSNVQRPCAGVDITDVGAYVRAEPPVLVG